MNRAFAARLSVAALCLGAAPAYADITFHGFGQVVVGSTLSNNHTNFPNGLGYGADPSFNKESLFALQVQAPIANRLFATAQLVGSGANNNDFTPKFEWAYVSYQLNDTWSFKAGRQRFETYKYSDYLEVGEAYNWIRPPVNVYSGYVNNIDGVSATGYYNFGDFTLQPQLTYGNIDNTFNATYQGSGVSTTVVNHLTNAVNATLEIGYQDWLNVHLGYTYGSDTINISVLDPAIDAIKNSCAEVFQLSGNYYSCSATPNPDPAAAAASITPLDNSSVVDGLNTNNNTTTYFNGGIEIEKFHFILLGEYAGLRINNSLLPRNNEYYGSLGYKWGWITPMLTYGHTDSASSNPGALGQVAPGSAVLVGVQDVGGGNYVPLGIDAKAYVKSLVEGQRSLQDTYEFGIRFDTSKNTAFKLDYTRYLNHAPDYVDPTGAVQSTRTGVSLLSAAFVFVF